MALAIHSLFYYGHKVDSTNNKISLKDGAGPELIAEIPVGSYTLSKYIDVVNAALNAASALDWTYALNRITRKVTFTTSGPASLLFATGSTLSQSAAPLLGFNAVDKLNLTSFVADFGSGSSYSPQFPLQEYRPKNQNKRLINPVVSKSANGDKVSIQAFGIERLIKFNIKNVTNYPGYGLLRNNPQAVEELETFMDYIVEKNPIEFMEDEANQSSFDKVYLQSTPQDQEGTYYELKEYWDQNLPGFFESGLLTFKVINVE